MLNSIPQLPEWAQTIIFPVNRWLHIVCTALIVGGTLFYEFVLPRALEDLREEAQLAVFGRVRWIFRRVVVLAAVVLVVTGAVAGWRLWPIYRSSAFRWVPPWVWAHVVLGLVALVVGVAVTNRARAPRHPLIWLRVNFVVLLIALFVAAVARHLRVAIQDDMERDNLVLVPHPDRPTEYSGQPR
jgi:hypothetical protein